MIIVLDDRTRIRVVTPLSNVERNNNSLSCSLSVLFVVCISVVVLYCIVQFFYNANCQKSLNLLLERHSAFVSRLHWTCISHLTGELEQKVSLYRYLSAEAKRQ